MRMNQARSAYEFIALGCSVGGIEALKFLLQELPADFPIPIGVVQHRGADSDSMMIRYFKDVFALKVIEPEDKEPIVPGAVYFAPANYHMLVGEDHCFHLNVDDPVYFSRPSIDVFFSSAALVFRKNLVGVIMSGANADGAEGLRQIQNRGGEAIVQDPATAYHRTMPEAALAALQGEIQVLDLAKIKHFIHSLFRKEA